MDKKNIFKELLEENIKNVSDGLSTRDSWRGIVAFMEDNFSEESLDKFVWKETYNGPASEGRTWSYWTDHDHFEEIGGPDLEDAKNFMDSVLEYFALALEKDMSNDNEVKEHDKKQVSGPTH